MLVSVLHTAAYQVPVSHKMSQKGFIWKYSNSIYSYREFLNERRSLRAEENCQEGDPQPMFPYHW